MTDAECVELLRWALPRLRMRWTGFRRVRRQVCRRIRRRMDELGISEAAAYRAHLEAHPAEWERLDAACRISISRLFRDRSVFEALETRVLPALAERARAGDRARLRAWSAGCASGEEPASLAILWHHALAPRFPDIDLEILATDVDPHLVERARRARFRPSSVKEVPTEWLASAFQRIDDLFRLRRELSESVELHCQDIRREMPDGLFDLVLCRNLAFTYFDRELQGEVLAGILARLRPGGALVVGLHEAPPETAGLAPWPGARGVYERRPERPARDAASSASGPAHQPRSRSGEIRSSTGSPRKSGSSSYWTYLARRAPTTEASSASRSGSRPSTTRARPSTRSHQRRLQSRS